MELDLKTFAIILSFTHLLQTIIFLYLYFTVRNYRGIGYWLLWSFAETVGFLCMFLRHIPSIETISILIQNSMIILGVIFLYLGIVHFFDKKPNYPLVFGIYTVYISLLSYFLLIDNNIWIRGIVISATFALVAFLTAYVTFFWRPNFLTYSANFNGIFFFIHGSFFVVRTIFIIKDPIHVYPNIPTVLNIATFIDGLVVSIVWTYTFVIMINQRLLAEINNTREIMERLFNTSPDSIIIIRLSDGKIAFVNDGFTKLSGFTREESVGKTTSELGIWKSPEDRDNFVEGMSKEGFLDNFEAELRKKDGNYMSGLISAQIVDIHNTEHVIAVTRDITARKIMEEKLHSISITDELTGLYNRRGFIMLAEQQLKITHRTNKQALLFFIDLDKMKHINDTLGHQEGDRALIDVSNILRDSFRKSDIIGRLGGDEFAVLAIDTGELSQDTILERLNNMIAIHNDTSGRKYKLSLSIGVVLYFPSNPVTLDELISKADDLMYENKKRNRSENKSDSPQI